MKGSHCRWWTFGLFTALGIVVGWLVMSPIVEVTEAAAENAATIDVDPIPPLSVGQSERSATGLSVAPTRTALARSADPDLGVVVYGSLTDEAGQPMEAGSLRFRFADGRPDVRAYANAGQYSVTGMLPGSC
jgi:hypothetical protein